MVVVRSDDPEYRRRLRRRNLALAGVLLGLVGLFYVITVIKVGGSG
jgi:hypothetical protein